MPTHERGPQVDTQLFDTDTGISFTTKTTVKRVKSLRKLKTKDKKKKHGDEDEQPNSDESAADQKQPHTVTFALDHSNTSEESTGPPAVSTRTSVVALPVRNKRNSIAPLDITAAPLPIKNTAETNPVIYSTDILANDKRHKPLKRRSRRASSAGVARSSRSSRTARPRPHSSTRRRSSVCVCAASSRDQRVIAVGH